MAEGDCKKRKVLFFILFTLSLIFVGIYIQYKVNILAAPAVIRKDIRLAYGLNRTSKKTKIKHEYRDYDGYESNIENILSNRNIKKSEKGFDLKMKKWQTDDGIENIINEYNVGKDVDAIMADHAAVNKVSKILFDETTIESNLRTTISTRKRANVIFNEQVQKIGEFKRRFPKAIIGGVKKGGTRALLSFLGKHPLVRSGGREMHFFDKNDRYAKGLNFYLRQMPNSFENELTIEKTPGYFVKQTVPKRIYKFSKTVKLIFIFRNPVERAISDYAQAISKEWKEGKRFERLVFTKTKPRVVDKSNSKVSIGLYAHHLKRWLQYFPLKQMYFVNGDDFIKNPVPEIINVQKFLNLPVLIDENSFYFNATKGFYCILVTRDGRNVTSDCLGSTKGRKHPFVKQGTIDKLTEFYKPYNRELFTMINKDFGWAV